MRVIWQEQLTVLKPVLRYKKAAKGITGNFHFQRENELQTELDRTGTKKDIVQSRYKTQESQTMSEDLYKKRMTALSRMRSADAA